MDEANKYSDYDLERLLFRRQFLLGPREYLPNAYWESLPLVQHLVLSVHCDLPYYIKRSGDRLVALLGIALDPGHPEFTENDILDALVSDLENIKSLTRKTWPLSGRWLVIFQDSDNTYLFTDPFGFRSIFYSIEGESSWCASQPELIRTQCDINYSTDHNFLEYQHSADFSRMESPAFGSNTIFQSCKHLLPNHYLDVKQALPVRFYPTEELSPKTQFEGIIQESTELLKGIFTAVTTRYESALALSSGWDSRLLLAASRDVQKKILYFVDRKGILEENHPDVWVPGILAKSLSLNFEVRSSELELPGWFVSLLSNNVTGARVLPKSRMIYSKYLEHDQKVYLNGNGGEIIRNYYDKTCSYDIGELNIGTIIRLIGFQKQYKFIYDQIETWLNDIDFSARENINILDYLYWEQRIGNWGAQFPSEQDIAVEELSPLNCRQLINNLLSTPREARAAPDYPVFKAMILNLWPEILELPINPPAARPTSLSLRNKLMRRLRGMISRD